MITDFEAIELEQHRMTAFSRPDLERIEFLQLLERGQPSFRSRTAIALISLGIRIDRSAAPRTPRYGSHLTTH